MTAKTGKLSAFDETNATLGAALKAAQDAVSKAGAAIGELDIEIGQLLAQVNELYSAPPSLDEVVEHVLTTLRNQRDIWRNGAVSALMQSAIPSTLISMPGIIGYDGAGEDCWSTSKKYPLNIIAHNGDSKTLHTIARDDAPMRPFLLAGLLEDVLAPRVEQWLREDCKAIFPAKAVLPLSERPQAIAELRSQIETLRAKRAEMERQLTTMVPAPQSATRAANTKPSGRTG